MLMCCDNPINLGCVGSCENITTDIVVFCSSSYTIQYEFNGAIISYTMQADKGYLSIPSGVFNEDYNTTFKVKDMSGQVVGCYNVNVSPSVGYPIQLGNVLTSRIELVSGLCVNGIPTAEFPVELNIILNDSTLLESGTTITLDVNIDPDTIIYGLSSLNTNAYSVTGNTITIIDVDDIENNTINLRLNIVIPNCDTSFEAQASISCYNNLPSNTILGLQTPSNIIIN